MRMLKRAGGWITILAVVGLVACSSSSPTETEQDKAPDLPDLNKLKVTVPQGAPPQVQGIALAANGFIAAGYGWIGQASSTNPTGSGGSYQWSVTQNGLTLTIKADVQSDGSVKWTVTLNGTDPNSGTTYNNWVALSGSTDAEGKNGQFTIYEENSTNVAAQITWSEDSNGNRTITMSSSEGLTWKIVANADGSGSVVTEENGKKTFEASWTANGSGTWASYDPQTGQQTGSGSWSS